MTALRITYPVTFALLLLLAWPVRLVASRPTLLAYWGPLSAVLHMLGFLVLSLLMLSLRGRIPTWLILLGLVAWAGGSEMAQTLMPRRVADPVDFLMNLAGIALAVALVRLLPPRADRAAVAGQIAPATPRARRAA